MAAAQDFQSKKDSSTASFLQPQALQASDESPEAFAT
jgi:hypothetical protein